LIHFGFPLEYRHAGSGRNTRQNKMANINKILKMSNEIERFQDSDCWIILWRLIKNNGLRFMKYLRRK